MDWLKVFFACEIIIDMSRYSENRIVMLEGYIQCIYIYTCSDYIQHICIICSFLQEHDATGLVQYTCLAPRNPDCQRPQPYDKAF